MNAVVCFCSNVSKSFVDCKLCFSRSKLSFEIGEVYIIYFLGWTTILLKVYKEGGGGSSI